MENLKIVSIRARVAYGIICFELLLKYLNYDTDRWALILKELWRFTDSDIGIWHEQMSEMTPFSILEKISFNSKGCEYLSEIEHNLLQELYEDSNIDALKIIDIIFEIGTSDLYSSINDNSPYTIECIIQVCYILSENGISLPDVKLFEKF